TERSIACASSRRGPRISKRPAALSPCAVRLSFLLARRPVTRRAKGCGHCPIDGGVHGFPLQGSEVCRERQKRRKRIPTPATGLFPEQGESQCSSSLKASLSAISWPTPSPSSCSSYGSGCSSSS